MKNKIKINFFDIIVIVAVLALAAFLGLKFFGGDDSSSDVQIRLTYTTNEISDFVVEKMEKGSRMYDDDNKVDLGYLEEISVGDSLSSFVTDDGEWVETDKPDYSSMVLTSTVPGKKLENGVEIGGHTYFLGDFIILRSGVSKVYIEITKFEVVE